MKSLWAGKPTKNLKTSSLSARLLMLTVGFVMIAQILIFVPSVSNYRKSWLEERLAAAQIATLAVTASPDRKISEILTKELLESAGVLAVRHVGQKANQPIIGSIKESEILKSYDLREPSYWQLLSDAFKTLAHTHPHQKTVSVTGSATDLNDKNLQIVFNEERLCHDMWVYSGNVLLLSLFISFVTAGLLYYALNYLFVSPVKEITSSLIAFRKKPEDRSTQMKENNRQDEIGTVMSELANMQDKVRSALNQKNHLASLGEAVSKINHDLRNILASAQLVSDNLAEIDNPIVKKLTPRFVSAIDRAIRLCDHTLEYGSTQISSNIFERFALRPIIDDVTTSLGLTQQSDIKLVNDIPSDLLLTGDADQIFRIFMNLSRNAIQAMGHGKIKEGKITVGVLQEEDKTYITVTDTAGGIPKMIRKHLFKPFSGSQNGGTGLGLAISREIIESHGGSISLNSTTGQGSEFRLFFP